MGWVVLSLRLCAVIALAVAGCYRPDIARCYLACADNDACPDGLVCNASGVCASSLADNCTDVPGDAGSDADAQIVMTTVKVEVLGPTGAPQNDVRVVFSTPAGDMISEARTDVTGIATSDVPVGSSATIIRINGSNYNATTYTDLWDRAHVVSKFTPTVGERAITLNWAAPATGNVVYYFVYSTCNSSPVNTTTLTFGLDISNNCPKYDLVIIGKTNAGTAVRILTAENLDSSTSMQAFTQSQWKVMNSSDAIDINLMGVPNGMNEVQISPYLTPALAYTTPIVTSAVPMAGNVGPLAFPREIDATIALVSSAMIAMDVRTQLYVERLPPMTTAYNRDMAMRKFPWLGPATLDLPTKTLSWPIDVPPGVVPPPIAMVKLSFRRGAANHDWHVISRGSHVTQTGSMGSFVLPEIPGDNPFEPLDGDTNVDEEVIYLGATPGTEDALRAGIQSHEATLDIFGIPGLTYVFRATAE